MSKRAEIAALKSYPEETRFVRDYNQLAKRQIYQEGYEQAEKDMMLEMKQWILRQRGFGKVAFQDFEKYMRENGHE